MYKPTLIKSNIRFAKGMPVGANKPAHIAEWRRNLKNPQSLDDMITLYDYKVLQNIFPWAVTFRAGIIFYDTTTTDLLFVRQKQTACFDARTGKTQIIPERFEFPKGGVTPADKSAIDTAFREFHEETGVDLQNYNGHMLTTVFVVPRAGMTVEEVIIYFIVIAARKPDIVPCPLELAGYDWISARSNLRNILPVTTPMKLILNELANWDLTSASDYVKL